MAGIVIVAGAAWMLGLFGKNDRTRSYEATRAETPEEKFRTAAEVYSSGTGARIDPTADPSGIAKLLESVVAAHRDGDANRFYSYWNFRRLLAQMQSPEMPQIRTREEEEAFLRGLRNSIHGNFDSTGVSKEQRWDRVRVLKIRFTPERSEADAFCRVRFGNGLRRKFHFWMIKEQEFWRIFDFEQLEVGFRMSSMAAALVAISAPNSGSTAWLASAQAFISAFLQAELAEQMGDGPRLHEATSRARSQSPPSAFLALLDMFEGEAFMFEQKYPEALRKFDEALQRKRDLAIIPHLKAQVEFVQGHYEECIRLETEFLGMLGEDPEALLSVGASYASLNQLDKAIETLEKGAAADEEDAAVRYYLARVLATHDRLDQALPPLKAALGLDPSLRQEAKQDPDFEKLRVRRDFQDLVGLPHPNSDK